MRKRCYQCKCLEWESSIKFYQRTKDNPKNRFYCKKCDPVRKERISKSLEKGKKTRERKKEIKHFQDICRIQVEIEDEKRRIQFKKFNATEAAKRGRRRYSNTDKGRGAESVKNYNYRLRKMKIHDSYPNLSMEERCAIGRFYRKCPKGCEVDHIIPVSKGGRHELSNLQYLTKEEHLKKTAQDRTKKIKNEIHETYPFTPVPEGTDEIEFSSTKRNKGSKYKKVRRLLTR